MGAGGGGALVPLFVLPLHRPLWWPPVLWHLSQAVATQECLRYLGGGIRPLNPKCAM